MLVGTLVNDIAISIGVAFVLGMVWIIITSDEPPRRSGDDRHAPGSL